MRSSMAVPKYPIIGIVHVQESPYLCSLIVGGVITVSYIRSDFIIIRRLAVTEKLLEIRKTIFPWHSFILAAVLLLPLFAKAVSAQTADSLRCDSTIRHEKRIAEVVVTASEGNRMTSSSVINRLAIEHLQPSSLADLMALLPGGSTSVPRLTQANSLRLRQAGSGNSNYDISALGTQFVTDGIPISTQANMQRVRQANGSGSDNPDAGRNHTSTGVDMRTIGTDQIESLEVIRGIAPVEYGDLTSGVVIIRRTLKATPVEARFKADSYSKLFYLGKGIGLGSRSVLNLGLDWLDAKADPRNSLLGYRRLTASARLQHLWNMSPSTRLRWRMNADYTGSFDKEKHDAEVLKQKDDSYRSDYHRMSMSHSLLLTHERQGESLLQPSGTQMSVSLDAAVSYEKSTIEQTRQISLSRDIAVSTTLSEGEHDGTYLPYHYLSEVTVDGRPMSFYAKLKGLVPLNTGPFSHLLNAGIDWKTDKNYGKGQQYDPSRPLSPGTPYRPRVYSDIPASHQAGLYLQDKADLHLFSHRLTAEGGLRLMQMAGLSSRYAMHHVWYADPRVNVQWSLPPLRVGADGLALSLSGGWGRQTKFPTMLQLYPDKVYNDIIELNYYDPTRPEFRRLHLRTCVYDPTPYQLRPARNDKWEVRLGGRYAGYQLSVTYFREHMSSGFRTTGIALPASYRDYDEQSIVPSALTSQPRLEDLPYTDRRRLDLYGQTTNGSQLDKEGFEYQLSTRRYRAIGTRLTVNGAWFRTTYTNSEAQFRSVTSRVLSGTPVNTVFMGYYDSSSGNIARQLNTNVMADTYIERLGLAFSLTAEATWYYKTRSMVENGIPLAYMDQTGAIHPYTESDRTDTWLQWLEQKFNESAFLEQKTPFWLFVNLKVTKDFGRQMKLALFVDRMIDYMPDYETLSGMTVRRTSKPWFGMEMNVRI